jgi:hypothetical protein
LLVAAYFDFAPAFPLATEMIAEERSHGAHRLVDGGILEPVLVAQGDQEVGHLRLAQLGDVAPPDGRLQPPRPGEVGFPRSRRELTQLDVADEVPIPAGLSECGAGDGLVARGLACGLAWALAGCLAAGFGLGFGLGSCFHSTSQYEPSVNHQPTSLHDGAAKRLRSTNRAVTTPTSCPVSMFFGNYHLNPVIDARPRW